MSSRILGVTRSTASLVFESTIQSTLAPVWWTDNDNSNPINSLWDVSVHIVQKAHGSDIFFCKIVLISLYIGNIIDYRYTRLFNIFLKLSLLIVIQLWGGIYGQKFEIIFFLFFINFKFFLYLIIGRSNTVGIFLFAFCFGISFLL